MYQFSLSNLCSHVSYTHDTHTMYTVDLYRVHEQPCMNNDSSTMNVLPLSYTCRQWPGSYLRPLSHAQCCPGCWSWSVSVQISEVSPSETERPLSGPLRCFCYWPEPQSHDGQPSLCGYLQPTGQTACTHYTCTLIHNRQVEEVWHTYHRKTHNNERDSYMYIYMLNIQCSAHIYMYTSFARNYSIDFCTVYSTCICTCNCPFHFLLRNCN